MASLCLLSESGKTEGRWEIGDKPLAVGRGAMADVIVEDEALSRRHFEILREGSYYVLKDLGSENGTFVDGKPAKATKLGKSDCIMAGRSIFVFTSPNLTATGRIQTLQAEL